MAQKLLEAAEAFEKNGEWEEAAKCYQKLLKSNPQNTDYIRSLAYTLFRMGKNDEAFHYWRQEMALRSKWQAELKEIGLQCYLCGEDFPDRQPPEFPWEIRCPHCGEPAHMWCMLVWAEIFGECAECGNPLGIKDGELTGEGSGLVSGSSFLDTIEKQLMKREAEKSLIAAYNRGMSLEEEVRFNSPLLFRYFRKQFMKSRSKYPFTNFFQKNRR